jgi:hypothetical protein
VAFADIEDRLRAEQVLRERDAVLGAREDSLRRIATLVGVWHYDADHRRRRRLGRDDHRRP